MVSIKDGWLKDDVERAAQRVDYWQGKEKASVTSEVSNSERWDRRFLELAKHISTWSKDPSTKTGCVITNDQRDPVSWGYNGFPRGFNDRPDMYADRETKLKWIAHAERNGLDLAQTSLKGCTIYITHPPCTECQKSIVQKGIKRVVWYAPNEQFKTRWVSDFELLRQAQIETKEYNETI